MGAIGIRQNWFFHAAARKRQGAARVKAAATRNVHPIWRISLQDDAFLPVSRVGYWNYRD